jgi:hypothetical protein
MAKGGKRTGVILLAAHSPYLPQHPQVVAPKLHPFAPQPLLSGPPAFPAVFPEYCSDSFCFCLTSARLRTTAHRVKRQLHPVRSAACALALAVTPGSALAELPNLKERPWEAYFAAFESRKFNFSLDTWGQGKVIGISDQGKELGHNLEVAVVFLIEEVLPSGKVTSRKIDVASLETKDKPIFKQGKATFRGKVTDDATFEAHIEIARGTILVGGRLLEAGKIKNPLRFGVRTTFLSAYKSSNKGEKTEKEEKDAAKAFAKKIKGDRIEITWTDGKRTKFGSDEKLDPESKKANGPGISELKVEMIAYQGRSFEFKAPPQTKILLWARQEQEAHEGFSATWYPDPAKDPEGKSRLAIEVR